MEVLQIILLNLSPREWGDEEWVRERDYKIIVYANGMENT